MGLIERVGLPGRRRDYFQIKSGAWTQLVRHAVYELSALRKLAERGLELMEAQDSELKQRLQEARDLFSYMEREYPLLIERWEKEHKKTSK
jgi:DNA-binding transcriptional regulator GbsR (MarR family)